MSFQLLGRLTEAGGCLGPRSSGQGGPHKEVSKGSVKRKERQEEQEGGRRSYKVP